ncbi:hypothetical protein [Methylibium sp. T29]|nr:hypothetical protein [Methylibium sp. T29]
MLLAWPLVVELLLLGAAPASWPACWASAAAWCWCPSSRCC